MERRSVAVLVCALVAALVAASIPSASAAAQGVVLDRKTRAAGIHAQSTILGSAVTDEEIHSGIRRRMSQVDVTPILIDVDGDGLFDDDDGMFDDDGDIDDDGVMDDDDGLFDDDGDADDDGILDVAEVSISQIPTLSG